MCGAAALAPSWDRLTDRDQLTGFMEKLKRAGVGPEGQLGKLDAITSALKYYKTHLLKDVTSPELAKTDLILTAVQGWKSTLRKEMYVLSVFRTSQMRIYPLTRTIDW